MFGIVEPVARSLRGQFSLGIASGSNVKKNKKRSSSKKKKEKNLNCFSVVLTQELPWGVLLFVHICSSLFNRNFEGMILLLGLS